MVVNIAHWNRKKRHREIFFLHNIYESYLSRGRKNRFLCKGLNELTLYTIIPNLKKKGFWKSLWKMEKILKTSL